MEPPAHQQVMHLEARRYGPLTKIDNFFVAPVLMADPDLPGPLLAKSHFMRNVFRIIHHQNQKPALKKTVESIYLKGDAFNYF